MTISGTTNAALSHALERVNHAAEGVAKASRPTIEAADQLDMSTEAVHLLVAKNGYDAAIELAKTSDEISRQTIDLLA